MSSVSSTPPTRMVEPTQLPAAAFDVVAIASPLFFGPLLNWALYGALCVQFYIYTSNFPDDEQGLKILAYFVFLLETAQTVLTGCDVYYWFVEGYGNPEQFAHLHYNPIDLCIMLAVSSFLVQGYFSYRIWVLNRRLGSSWFCWIIAAAAVTNSVVSVWAGIATIVVARYSFSVVAMLLWSIASAVADIMITVAMIFLLRRSNTTFSSFILVRVVRLTIETNGVTAALALMALVLYLVFPKEIYYIYPCAIIGKVYTNTLLANLNNRIYFRDHSAPHPGRSLCNPVSDLNGSQATPSSTVPKPQGDVLDLIPISHTVGISSCKDDASTTSSLPHPRGCYLFSEDRTPECSVGTSSHSQG